MRDNDSKMLEEAYDQLQEDLASRLKARFAGAKGGVKQFFKTQKGSIQRGLHGGKSEDAGAFEIANIEKFKSISNSFKENLRTKSYLLKKEYGKIFLDFQNDMNKLFGKNWYENDQFKNLFNSINKVQESIIQLMDDNQTTIEKASQASVPKTEMQKQKEPTSPPAQQTTPASGTPPASERPFES